MFKHANHALEGIVQNITQINFLYTIPNRKNRTFWFFSG